ncbi:LOW QUALITY PROTEIN: hypothetical protein ACHAWF_007145 [Thalassiosira exigua]
MFVEEIVQDSNTKSEDSNRSPNIGASVRYKMHVNPCYGRENVAVHELVDLPMICSGTIIRTDNGIQCFLLVLNSAPTTRADHSEDPPRRPASGRDNLSLYSKGNFCYRHNPKALPLASTCPVLMVGKPCATANGVVDQNDMMMVMFHNKDSSGGILNPGDKEVPSLAHVVPILQQWGICPKWINPWFGNYMSIFLPKNAPVFSWRKIFFDKMDEAGGIVGLHSDD